MTGRTFGGGPLTPGVNVDPVSLTAGLQMAQALGYVGDERDRMVVVYALQRWARGEEDGAQRTWMDHFGRSEYVSWLRVISHAIVEGKRALKASEKRWVVVYSRPGFTHPITGETTP